MRFVFAIVAFIAAAVMIGLGIAQRTVFLEPDRVSMSAELSGGEADFIVIEPEALAAHPGKQTITVSGSPKVFLSYGRSSDVEAWLGDTPYVSVGYDTEAGELTNEIIVTKPVADSNPTAPVAPPVEGAAETAVAPTPDGSDLWLDEFTDDLVLTTTIDVPEDISVLVSANGGGELPSRVKIDWPLDNATPWAGPLIVGGAIVFLIGIALVIAGFVNHRRMRGPRRNQPGGTRGKLPSAPKPGRTQVGSRRAIGRAKRIAIVPFLVIPALALSACSADYWPSFDQQAAPETTAPATPLATPGPTDEPVDDTPKAQPAVTVPQMERIMRRVAVFATDVDASRDATAAAERFTGPALEARTANYAIRGSLPDHPVPTPIPASPLTLTLPQQATGWPRTVLTIAKNSDDPTIAPNALVLVQETPRDNYKILYAISLAPDADVPEVAPASIGAPPISPEFKGLVMPTGQVAAAYADVLMKGEASEFFPMFDPEGDTLIQQLGPAGQKAINDGLQDTVDATYSNAVGDSPTIALATNDAGALVSVSIEQTENVVPNDGGTIGFKPGAAAALSGFTGKSAKGVQRVIGIQLLFYVPGVGNESEDQIRLLGWSESLIGASEVP
ncbi:hypothetical protein SAMN05443544_0502 [Agromyces cerinus subsp. cerinus]|uniref:DUF8094 domain-containing protein n=1 Tax=Agromyces cerinus subsp. cerinus TaxID=232089 RepID=A0A1N6DNB6_9MICO|nr:hypothetical protein SAMN05443544_0502 [Agromyces cerinus subsp. cerinus]